MRVLRVLAVLMVGVAGSVAAQLAAPQPTEKLLILPLLAAPADSAASVATMDAARAKLISIARYKVNVIPKTKLCEVLGQSGFGCDVLITPQQAEQLSKALGIPNYTGGWLSRSGNLYVAKVHVVSGASGFSSSFTINGGTTPAALGEQIALRLANIVKASENARNCNDQRSRNALDHALVEARKAFAIEPNLTEAWACIATIWELKKQPDSMMQAYRGALKGDSANAGVWSRLANLQMARGDTDGALGTYAQELQQNPTDKNLRLALAGQQLQRKKYVEALALVDSGLKVTPADQQLSETRRRIVQDGTTNATDPAVKKTMSEGLLGMMRQEATTDTTRLADTNNLKLAMGTAEAAFDTTSYLWWAHQAAHRYPNRFRKTLATAFSFAGQRDSAIAIYKQILASNPGDVAISLQIAQFIIDNAAWDTTVAKDLLARKDTIRLRSLQQAFADRLDSASQYIRVGLSSDSTGRYQAAQVAYAAGVKLVQAGNFGAAYRWLEPTQLLLERDTVGPREQFARAVNLYYGLASTYSILGPIQDFGKSKKCDQGPALSERLKRTRRALSFGGRIAPPTTIQQPMTYITQFEGYLQQVKKAYRCSNF